MFHCVCLCRGFSIGLQHSFQFILLSRFHCAIVFALRCVSPVFFCSPRCPLLFLFWHNNILSFYIIIPFFSQNRSNRLKNGVQGHYFHNLSIMIIYCNIIFIISENAIRLQNCTSNEEKIADHFTGNEVTCVESQK